MKQSLSLARLCAPVRALFCGAMLVVAAPSFAMAPPAPPPGGANNPMQAMAEALHALMSLAPPWASDPDYRNVVDVYGPYSRQGVDALQTWMDNHPDVASTYHATGAPVGIGGGVGNYPGYDRDVVMNNMAERLNALVQAIHPPWQNDPDYQIVADVYGPFSWQAADAIQTWATNHPNEASRYHGTGAPIGIGGGGGSSGGGGAGAGRNFAGTGGWDEWDNLNWEVLLGQEILEAAHYFSAAAAAAGAGDVPSPPPRYFGPDAWLIATGTSTDIFGNGWRSAWAEAALVDVDRDFALQMHGALWTQAGLATYFDPLNLTNRVTRGARDVGSLSGLSSSDTFRLATAGDLGGLNRFLAQPFNVILTWGSGVFDADLHLTGPLGASRFHVYFSSQGSLTGPPFAELVRMALT
jgi:hypothetical protein